MSPAELRRLILHLDSGGPIHLQLEADLRGDRISRPRYRDQREHLLGWLGEYSGPGAYGRVGGVDRDAAFFWTHFQCAPGLAWFAEAAGIPAEVLMLACEAARMSGSNYAARCGAFRRVIPWTMVEARLQRPAPPLAEASPRASVRSRRQPRMVVPAGVNDNEAVPPG